MKSKIYIAGKITGDENYKEKFAEVAEILEDTGCVVLNPAILPEGLSKTEYMKICFAMIDTAGEVLFLPDWTDSKGAKLEHAYSMYVDKHVTYY